MYPPRALLLDQLVEVAAPEVQGLVAAGVVLAVTIVVILRRGRATDNDTEDGAGTPVDDGASAARAGSGTW